MHIYYRFLGRVAPEKLAKVLLRKSSIDGSYSMKNPKSLNEKINWLKFHTDTFRWTLLADKYRVREYVAEQGLDDTLCTLYGVWKRPEEIDFQTLPDRFVLKTNNGSGSVILVDDKALFLKDWKKMKTKLKRWMKTNYGLGTAELHYRNIPPCILAEEYLDDKSDSISILDYKVHCCSGEPCCIVVCHDRIGHSTKFTLYDPDWTPRFERVPAILRGNKIFPKPNVLEKMLEYSRRLSKEFPFVRVDWYVVGDKLYFGEMTFTPSGGYIGYIDSEYLRELGDKVTLPQPKRS